MLEKLRLPIFCILPFIISFCGFCNGENKTNFAMIAQKESMEPIHPGIPGKRPFWNTFSKRFIYAPAFDFKAISDAETYRFSILSEDGEEVVVFEAENPWLPLTPIWDELPFERFQLTVEALGLKNGKDTQIVGQREFLKSPSFFVGTHLPVMLISVPILLDSDK